MSQGENVVDNIAKRDNNQIPLRAFSIHAVRTSIKDNERMNNLRKSCMLAEVSAEKGSPWLANKCSEKDASVERSGRRTSRFKIYKFYMFITMCHMEISSYVDPKWMEPNPLGIEYTH